MTPAVGDADSGMNPFLLPFWYSGPERAVSSSSSPFDKRIYAYRGLVITPKEDESGRFCRCGMFEIDPISVLGF